MDKLSKSDNALRKLTSVSFQHLNYPGCQTLPESEPTRRSAAASRRLRMLRAHGLIQRVPKTHRYQVTATGRLAISAVLTMSQTSMSGLNEPRHEIVAACKEYGGMVTQTPPINRGAGRPWDAPIGGAIPRSVRIE